MYFLEWPLTCVPQIKKDARGRRLLGRFLFAFDGNAQGVYREDTYHFLVVYCTSLEVNVSGYTPYPKFAT